MIHNLPIKKREAPVQQLLSAAWTGASLFLKYANEKTGKTFPVFLEKDTNEMINKAGQ